MKRKSVQSTREVINGKPCKILVPRVESTHLTLEEAIEFCMQHTEETNKETFFKYDPQTKQVLSSIAVGDCTGVEEPFEEWGIIAKGTFHTHSAIKVTEEPPFIIEKPPEEKKCGFSTGDLHTDFVTHNREEIKVGCPFSNEILTLQYDPIVLKSLLFELARMEEKFRCDMDIGNAVNMWSSKLKELIPEAEAIIEKSRYEWLTKGLPHIIDKQHSEFLKEVQEKAEKVVPLKSEKWKKEVRE